MSSDGSLAPHLQAILLFIRQYIDDKGYAPSVREIGKARGISSSSTVHACLRRLEKAGLLRRDAAKPRAMVVQASDGSTAPAGKPSLTKEMKRLPFVAFANIAPFLSSPESQRLSPQADQPEARQDGVGDVADSADSGAWHIPAGRLGPGDYFLTDMPDDSMRNRQLYAGDFLIIRRQNTANNSDMILGRLHDEFFLRTYSRGLRQVRLQAEHDDEYDSIEVIMANAEELEILGKIVGSVHLF
jgi:repressor LexA